MSKEALVFADSVRETEWRQECERAVNLIHKDYKYHMVSLPVCPTVSPRREATWLITEGGLSSELTSHGLYGENVFQMTG